ncbi:MAG TPA: HNH endonuclease [Thermoanaerobaculia bacterium]|jgi:hypothetical protein
MSQPRQRQIYDSCRILAPDGELMCLVSEKKARWYLERGLGGVVSEQPLTIVLGFEPNGKGHAGDPFYTRPRPNVCAGCGETEGLTLHHVVPRGYRRYFPDELKSHSCHDLVPLCVDCHDRYEAAAQALKRELAEEHAAPVGGDGRIYDRQAARVRKAACALERHATGAAAIPAARRAELEGIVREHFAVDELSPEILAQAAELDPHVTPEGFRTHGSLIVGALGDDLQGFVERWRRHFLEHMRPAHLPRDWSVERDVNT